MSRLFQRSKKTTTKTSGENNDGSHVKQSSPLTHPTNADIATLSTSPPKPVIHKLSQQEIPSPSILGNGTNAGGQRPTSICNTDHSFTPLLTPSVTYHCGSSTGEHLRTPSQAILHDSAEQSWQSNEMLLRDNSSNGVGNNSNHRPGSFNPNFCNPQSRSGILNQVSSENPTIIQIQGYTDYYGNTDLSTATAQVGSYASNPIQPNELHAHDDNSTGVQPYPSVLRRNFNHVLGSFNPNFYDSRSAGGSFNQVRQVSLEGPTINQFEGNIHSYLNTGPIIPNTVAGYGMSSAALYPRTAGPPQPVEVPIHISGSNGAQPPSPITLGNNLNQALGMFNSNFYNRRSHDGSFGQAQQVSVENPTFYEFQGDQNIHYCGNTGPSILDRLAGYAMLSATFDSSARDPPPRCHPGTRHDILGSVQKRLNDRNNKADVSWLEGAAGAGKSAIMQTIAETEAEKNTLGASLFFSRPNHRDDPHKIFTTIAYQLATKLPSYQEYLMKQMAADPSVLEKTMERQFNDLIIIPFAEKQLLGDHRGYVILLDGLDECKGTRELRRIIKLIGNFISDHRMVPLRWIIASRPEQHLMDAFSDIKSLLQSSFWPKKVPIDSEQSVRDVELYLEHEFTRIRSQYDDLVPACKKWPSERQFLAISRAASGLFIFASTVIRFIDDDEDPVRQLNVVLSVLGKQLNQLNLRVNPLALLDAVYEQILSDLSSDTLDVAMLIIGYLILHNHINTHHDCRLPSDLRFICDFLGLEQHALYAALRKLRSVLSFPEPWGVYDTAVQFLHTSFPDFLRDQKRSHVYSINLSETATHLWCRCMTILRQWMKTNSDDDVELTWVDDVDSIDVKSELRGHVSWIWSTLLSEHLDDHKAATFRLLLPIEELMEQLRELDFSYEQTLGSHTTIGPLITCLETHVDANHHGNLIRDIPLASLDRSWFLRSLYERGWVAGWHIDRFEHQAEQIPASDSEKIEEFLRTKTQWARELLDLMDGAKAFEIVVKVMGAPSKCCARLPDPWQEESYYFPYIA